MHFENIEKMYETVRENKGFDAIVVVSSARSQSQFWEKRLNLSKKGVLGEKAKVFSVWEDWEGGAGQLFGTLYAIKKVDALKEILKKQGTVAIYHTAGMGTRMAPLPLAEGANKSAIKLPRMLKIEDKPQPLTLLEGVIFQTEPRASRKYGPAAGELDLYCSAVVYPQKINTEVWIAGT